MNLDVKEKNQKETYLSNLYKLQPLTIQEDIKNYVLNPKDIDNEIEYLKFYITTKDVDTTKIVFIVEILSKCIRKHSDFRNYVKLLIDIIESRNDYKYSIFLLRIIRSILSTRFYIPLSYYLIKVLKNAFEQKGLTRCNKKIDLDCIKSIKDRVRTEEHQIFVIQEAQTYLIQHLSSFSRNIGFPELSASVIDSLKTIRFGIYKEVIDDLVKLIERQRDYVLTERTKLKISALNNKEIAEFSSKLQNLLVEEEN